MNRTAASPLLLQARALNEFVYCPRLFYYEYVEGIFVHNADTLAGAAVHQRVDNGKGALPRPRKSRDSCPEPQEGEHSDSFQEIHSRSVSLFSERLGVTAKLDLVESDASGNVSPVEYKKGAPKRSDEGLDIWPADRIQLGLQMILLQENGYPCSEGILYYRESRQRVTLRMSDDLVSWVEEQIAAARTIATGPIPPPLDHSPKCPRCSLVGVCLPDETQSLQPPLRADFAPVVQLDLRFDHLEQEAPSRALTDPFSPLPEIRLHPPKLSDDVRRLLTPNYETKALYLNTPGHYVSKKEGELVIKEEGKKVASFRLHDIHHLAVFGPVQISTAVVHALCEKGVPISYFTMGNWFYGITRGHTLTNVFTRIEQFKHAADPELAIQQARLFVYGKIRNQRTMLMRNHIEPPKQVLNLLRRLAGSALVAYNLHLLMGIEGSAALLYFSHFGGMLKGKEEGRTKKAEGEASFRFDFDGRNRRPPRDPVNALLSLAYSLLAKDCTLAAYAVGFDPYVGFLHQPRYGRPALALDLMEEFRPLVADSSVLSLLNNRMVDQSDFIFAGDSVTLTTAGRKRAFLAYEKRMDELLTHPVFGYKVSYRRAIELQARLLAKTLTGEIEQYVPLTTR